MTTMSKVYRFKAPCGDYDISVIGEELNIKSIDGSPLITHEGLNYLVLAKLCELIDRVEALEDRVGHGISYGEPIKLPDMEMTDEKAESTSVHL